MATELSRGQMRALGAHPQLAQRALDGVGGGPHAAALTVQGEDDGPPVADGDLVAVGEGAAGRGGDDVVFADPYVLVSQQFPDIARVGVQVVGVAVDAEPHRLVLGHEDGGTTGQRGDHQRLGQQPPHRVTGACEAPAPGGSAGGGTATRDAVGVLRTAHDNTPQVHWSGRWTRDSSGVPVTLKARTLLCVSLVPRRRTAEDALRIGCYSGG